MNEINLIATTAFGMEAVTARELDKLGYTEHTTENGHIYYKGDLEAICRSNLWLRTADRVLLNMGQFKALSFEDLFQGTKAIPWEEWLPDNAQFIVNGRSVKSKLFSIRDCQAIVKKAIAERLKSAYKKGWIEETGPRFKIEVALLNDIATLTIDTSGHGLHKRGYRAEVGGAPIKETLAAGLIMISRWRPDRALLDPFCGTGTIAIEAAMIGMNIAPGLNAHFDAEDWPIMLENGGELWKKAREEAENAVEKDKELRIYASDIDYFQLSLAMKHAHLAGVEDKIHFQKVDFGVTSSRYQYGFVITNPPYGERLMEKQETEELYKRMGRHFKNFPTWSFYVITSCETFEKHFGRKASKRRKLYNGNLKCDYYQFWGPKPEFKERNSEEVVE
jgi:putative N6-adenine-specific DNA methylase